MIVTTTHSVEGKTISKYCGVVAGEVILGTDVFKDMFAGIRYLTGAGRAPTNVSCKRPARWRCLNCKRMPSKLVRTP